MLFSLQIKVCVRVSPSVASARIHAPEAWISIRPPTFARVLPTEVGMSFSLE